MAVYFEDHTKSKSELRGENAEVFNVKAGGI
jgi:hypothetical protein